MEHIDIGVPSHIAHEPEHLAPILSERAGQVKPEPRGSGREPLTGAKASVSIAIAL